MAKVICGQCGNEFSTAQAELDHVCEVTGVKPTDPASMGPNYEAIQAAALERGVEEESQTTSDVKRDSAVNKVETPKEG